MLYYDYLSDSPIAPVVLCVSARGLCAVLIGKRSERRAHASLSALFPGCALERDAEAAAPFRKQILEYLRGERNRFSLPLDLSLVRTSFQRMVLGACQRIPYGQTRSYKEIAVAARSPRAVRAVGQALSRNPLPLVIPCHRVVGAGGSLGGFSCGIGYKKRLLALERRRA